MLCFSKKAKQIKRIEETTLLPKPYTDLYKKNTIVTVKVENVVEYGVFVQIQDENKGKGLLHITKFQNMYVKRIEDFLRIGDIIEDVKIIEVTQDSLLFSIWWSMLWASGTKRDKLLFGN